MIPAQWPIPYHHRGHMPNWRAQGSHRFYREADLLYFEVHGPFDVDDARVMFEEGEVIEKAYGYILAAFDNRNGPGMTAEARKYTNLKGRERTAPNASAIIGGSVAVRVMSQLLINALRLAGRPVPPILFCSREDEAMAWLAVQRQQFRSQRPSAQ